MHCPISLGDKTSKVLRHDHNSQRDIKYGKLSQKCWTSCLKPNSRHYKTSEEWDSTSPAQQKLSSEPTFYPRGKWLSQAQNLQEKVSLPACQSAPSITLQKVSHDHAHKTMIVFAIQGMIFSLIDAAG